MGRKNIKDDKYTMSFFLIAKTRETLMWYSPLYAVIIFYYHWLIKELFWPMAQQSKARNGSEQRYIESAESNKPLVKTALFVSQ